MHAEDLVLMKKIKSVGKKLNLKKHLVCGHAVHTPGDLEGAASSQANPLAAASLQQLTFVAMRSGHKGRDGRYYVVDFGRYITFPPFPVTFLTPPLICVSTRATDASRRKLQTKGIHIRSPHPLCWSSH